MAHLKNAQAIGNRRIDIHSFMRNTPALVGWHRIQCAHIVQAIGKFDNDDTNVFYNRQHHFTEIFGLCLGPAAKIDLCELTYPVNQFGHFFTKLIYQIFFQGWRVFDHIVQYCGDNTVGIHAHFTKDSGHGYRMADIGFTGNTALSLVCMRAKQISAVYFLDLLGFQISVELCAKLAKQREVLAQGLSVSDNFK